MHLLPQYGLSINAIRQDGFEVSDQIYMAVHGDNYFAMTKSLGRAAVDGKRVVAAEGARLKNIPPDLAAAPRAELLWQPASEAVARVMGLSNVLHGEVVKATPDRIQIAWRGHALEAVNSPTRSYLPPPDSPIAFFIRPEYVRLVRKDRRAPDAAHHMNLMRGTVVGEPTLGKGEFQSSRVLPGGFTVLVSAGEALGPAPSGASRTPAPPSPPSCTRKPPGPLCAPVVAGRPWSPRRGKSGGRGRRRWGASVTPTVWPASSTASRAGSIAHRGGSNAPSPLRASRPC